MANVGDKFIIEVDRIFSSGTKILYRIKGFNSLVFDENGIDKLEKPDESEAFKKGYAKATEDIQKAVRTFRVMNNEDRERYFDGKYISAAIFDTFDLREIVEKLQLYEEEKAKIRVGAEVEFIGENIKGIATYVSPNMISVLYEDGSLAEGVNPSKIRKTGRYFYEIEELLKKLKGGDNSEQISF